MTSAQLQRAMAAVKAMRMVGFDQGVAKAVLKKLLKVYESNWEYIEAENYRLLVDSILDHEESKVSEASEKCATVSNEGEISRKRLRHKQENPGPSLLSVESEASGETLIKRKKLAASTESPLINLNGETKETQGALCSYERTDGEQHEKESLVSYAKHQIDGLYQCDNAANAMCYTKPKIEQGSKVPQESIAVGPSIIPDKPMDENRDNKHNNSGGLDATMGLLTPSEIAPMNSGNCIQSFQVSAEKVATSELTRTPDKHSTNIDIASSNKGKSAANLAAESGNSQKTSKDSGSPGFHRRLTRRSLIDSSNLISLETQRESTNGLDSSQHIDGECNTVQENFVQGLSGKDSSGLAVPEVPRNNASGLTIFPHHEIAVIASSPLHDVNDMAKGEERIKISLINEFSTEKAPHYFNYIPCNVIYQSAHAKISLAQIGDKDCCLNCFSNCLSAPIPCPCAQETGGEFVYTSNGLLKKEFLDECISMNRNPDKHSLYCKCCPIEKFKTKDSPDPCKGHLVRKFIKECWSKCGCNKHCGNRVVQRGITHNLQVFNTDDGKGWGLRTLEELPKGSFVCEYVGEILTSKELYDRTLQRIGNANQTYPVLLDADWSSKEELRDEEALCIDATFYGNIGRFINHRCSDANMVAIPVEWEIPDRHYYHVAFFTTRKIEALEELTRDYGIDFKNHTHLFKNFKCRCGSRYCRGSSKARSQAACSK